MTRNGSESGERADRCTYGIDGLISSISFDPGALIANGISKLRGRNTVIKVSNFTDEESIRFKHDEVATFTKLGQDGVHFETTMVDLRHLEPGANGRHNAVENTITSGRRREALATEDDFQSEAGHLGTNETPATTLNGKQSSQNERIEIQTTICEQQQPQAQQPGGGHSPTDCATQPDKEPTDGRQKEGGSEAKETRSQRDRNDDVRVLIDACLLEAELITQTKRLTGVEESRIEIATVESQSAKETPQDNHDPWATAPLNLIPLEETRQTILGAEKANGEAQFKRVKDMLADNNRAAVYKRRTGPTKKDQERVRIVTEGPPQGRAPSRVSPAQLRQIREEVGILLRDGQIEPSESPWAAGVVLADKKDGTARFCVDLRLLNSVTKRGAYPLPRIDDTLARMAGLKWTSTVCDGTRLRVGATLIFTHYLDLNLNL